MIVYVLNPGSASTKLALAHIEGSEQAELPGKLRVDVERRELGHTELAGVEPEQLARLQRAVEDAVSDWPRPDAVVTQGHLRGAQNSGTFEVTSGLAEFARLSELGAPAERLSAALALGVARRYGVPAYLVGPPSLDEMLPEARVSGFPGVLRASRFHALNARLVARRAAHEVGKRFQDARVVVAHLGSATSITAFDRGRAIDTSGTTLDEGPFSPSRAGGLPLHGVLDLAYRLERPELERLLTTEAGFKGLTGTADLRELEQRERSEPEVRLALGAYAHQISKAIGAYSAIGGRPDVVAVTGGAARWEALVRRIEDNVGWVAPVLVIPGELELEALAELAGRVLLGLEQPRLWEQP